MSSAAGVKAGVVCIGCGETASGKYCSQCGESLQHARHSLWRLIEEVVPAFKRGDSAMLRSLKTLFRQPGELTRIHFEGPRCKCAGPVRFFLICNALFFVLQGMLGFAAFRATFDHQMHGQYYSQRIRERGKAFLARAQSEEAKQERKADYDRHSERLSKSLVIVLVPVFALVLALLLAGKGRYLVEHLVFSFHFYTFVLLWTPLCLLLFRGVICLLVLAVLPWQGHPWSTQLAQYLASTHRLDLWLSVLLIACEALYLHLSLRRYYRLRIFPALWRAIVLGGMTFPMMVLYRWFLFYVTIWTL